MRTRTFVPAEKNELSYDEYNHLLMDFHDHILRKLETDFPVTILASGDQRRLEDLMSANTFKLLQQFSGLTNKATGSAHPMDKGRWYGFLLAVNKERSRFTTTDLMRWLTNVENWPQRTAHDLVIEFEFAMGLLEAKRRTDQGGQNPPNMPGLPRGVRPPR